MCFDSMDRFTNMDRWGTLEELEDIAKQVGNSYMFGQGNPHHSHGGHSHSHSQGGHAHAHPESSNHRHLQTDGGTAATGGAGMPGPRYPARERNNTVEDLLPNARKIVQKDSSMENIDTEGGVDLIGNNSPGYEISEGERVLLVAGSDYDDAVISAFVQGIREEGARVDVISIDLEKSGGEIDTWYHEVPGIYVPEDYEGNLLELTDTPENRTFEEGVYPVEKNLLWWEPIAESFQREGQEVPNYTAPEYDLLIWGVGGPIARFDIDYHRYERIPWRTGENLRSEMGTYPKEVWNLIDQKTTEMIKKAHKVHLTDPEGTDLTFTNHYDDDGEYFPRGFPGHVFGHRTFPKEETDTTGTIAGTTNHAGAFPSVEIELKNGKVRDINGGGRYGELWRETMEETEKYQYHRYPGSGLFWLWEIAIGTNPKMARPSSRDLSTLDFPLIERLRSGVIHCGIGTPVGTDIEKQAEENGKPWGHVHIHLLFPTYEAETVDGEQYKVIDKGHLTALDDPEVREAASKYGDPDEILSEDWIPGIPGVNEEGDYQEDYGDNPMEWMNQERERFYEQ